MLYLHGIGHFSENPVGWTLCLFVPSIFVFVEKTVHKRFDVAALLFGGASRATVAADEYGFVRNGKFVEFRPGSYVFGILRYVFGRLAARYESRYPE